MPVIAFPCTIVSYTSQVFPYLQNRNLAFIPPETIQVLFPLITILVLLAAKAASPLAVLAIYPPGVYSTYFLHL
jgi:hypothetical protein